MGLSQGFSTSSPQARSCPWNNVIWPAGLLSGLEICSAEAVAILIGSSVGWIVWSCALDQTCRTGAVQGHITACRARLGWCRVWSKHAGQGWGSLGPDLYAWVCTRGSTPHADIMRGLACGPALCISFSQWGWKVECHWSTLSPGCGIHTNNFGCAKIIIMDRTKTLDPNSSEDSACFFCTSWKYSNSVTIIELQDWRRDLPPGRCWESPVIWSLEAVES